MGWTMTLQQQASEMVLGLPNHKASKVIEFVKMLDRVSSPSDIKIEAATSQGSGVSYTPTGRKLGYRNADVFRNGFISISDDFDEPLVEMKDYM